MGANCCSTQRPKNPTQWNSAENGDECKQMDPHVQSDFGDECAQKEQSVDLVEPEPGSLAYELLTGQPAARRPSQHDEGCTQDHLQHMQAEAHPEDSDYDITAGLLTTLRHYGVMSRAHCRFGDDCTRTDPKHWDAEAHPGDPDYPEELRALPHCTQGAQVELQEGKFDWIRHKNCPGDRAQRLTVARTTLAACRSRGYELEGSVVTVRFIDQMLDGTQFVEDPLHQLHQDASPSQSSQPLPIIEDASELTAPEAAHKFSPHERVVLMSPASAYHPCGGFRTGGRHALEETICAQSTLAVSLQRAFWLSRQPPIGPIVPPARVSHGDWISYIPEHGVILSPHVELFRGPYSTGYAFLQSSIKLAAVVSVAMPNLNRDIRDSPVDAPRREEDYRALLDSKLRAALRAASLAEAGVVIVPGLGCGVFLNRPQEVGNALGRAILSLAHVPGELRFHRLVLAGAPHAMLDALRQTLGITTDQTLTC
eukprot:TRINITY_DN21099_c0_g1_i1.p1 TRINITY_DN21099_c0_g1~~TRINITY_DN21099_c0_g1_i1.p1  ORF type:complete len:497 (-),score=42.18 TRINITY_DN21099_c0_g1_i1:325-1770(-)